MNYPRSNRQSQWWMASETGNIPTTGNAVIVDLLAGLGTTLGYNLNNLTTVRNIGNLQIYDASSPTAGDYADLTFGLVIGSDELDIADFNSNNIEAGDFLYLNRRRFAPDGTTAYKPWVPYEGMSWDNKSARKIPGYGKTLWGVFYANAAAAANVSFSLTNRTLVKLP